MAWNMMVKYVTRWHTEFEELALNRHRQAWLDELVPGRCCTGMYPDTMQSNVHINLQE